MLHFNLTRQPVLGGLGGPHYALRITHHAPSKSESVRVGQTFQIPNLPHGRRGDGASLKGFPIPFNPNSKVGHAFEKTCCAPGAVGRVTPCAPRLPPAGEIFPDVAFPTQCTLFRARMITHLAGTWMLPGVRRNSSKRRKPPLKRVCVSRICHPRQG